MQTFSFDRLVVVAAAGLAMACAKSASTPKVASTDPPTRVARLTGLDGNVSFQRQGDSAWSQATPNYSVTTGDRLYTEQNGRAELDLGSEAVRLAPGSDLRVRNLTNNFLQVGLNQGTLRASVYKQNGPDSLEIDTPNGALVPKGVGTYRVTIQQNGNVDPTYVTVETGAIEVTGPGVDQVVNAGQSVELSGDNPIQITNLTANTTTQVTPVPSSPALTSFDQWSTNRDMLYSPTSPVAQYVNTSTPGWEDLVSAVGSWLLNKQYGPVFQPTNLASNWTPYQQGHWAWVDPYGWTWVDDQPQFGFTTTHYGRWVDLPNGWAWVPGPAQTQPVFAPALVAFTDPSALGVNVAPDAQAYFPLAPNEPYFPWYHVSDDYVRAVNLADLRDGNVNALIDPNRVAAIQWANPARALVVVPGGVFANGLPVEREILHVHPDRADFVHIVPHPSINPGPPAWAVARGLREKLGQDAGEVVNPGRNKSFGPPAERALINRAMPAPARMPFEDQRKALEAHPGRPLEPQQIENMRGGKPAGPPRDIEMPKHEAAPHGPPRMPEMQPPQAPPPRAQEQHAAPPANAGGGGGRGNAEPHGNPGKPPGGGGDKGGKGRGKPN